MKTTFKNLYIHVLHKSEFDLKTNAKKNTILNFFSRLDVCEMQMKFTFLGDFISLISFLLFCLLYQIHE